MKQEICSELAELIGILLGDGSINIYPSDKYSTFYRVKISFHSEDREHVKYVRELFEKICEVRPKIHHRKNEQTTELLVFRKHIVEELLALGMKKAPKWERAVVPEQFMNSEYGKYVLRGYFDTDGSVVLTNNNGILYPRLEMKISPSPMQRQLQMLLDKYSFNYKTYNIGKGKVRVQMNGKKELKKWLKTIGFSNPKHGRKASKALHPSEYSCP